MSDTIAVALIMTGGTVLTAGATILTAVINRHYVRAAREESKGEHVATSEKIDQNARKIDEIHKIVGNGRAHDS